MISLQFLDDRGGGGSDSDGGGGDKSRNPAQDAEARGQAIAERVLNKAAFKLTAANAVRDRYPAHAYRLAVAARHDVRQLEAKPVASGRELQNKIRVFTRGATVLIDRLGAHLFAICQDECLPKVEDMERGQPGHAEWVRTIYEGLPREMGGGRRKRQRSTGKSGVSRARRRPRTRRTVRRRGSKRV